MIIWITGISGVGKTTLAKKLYKTLKKKITNIVHIDGDQFRKMFNNDLGYSLKDRDLNAQRMINFVKFLNQFKINIIISANLTSQKYRIYCKKNIVNFYEIHISAELKTLIKRDKKQIYNQKNKSKIVGIGIKNITNNTSFIKLENNYSKNDFLKNEKDILKKLKIRY
tara:strand:- start:502 stop:1005 length:504 start_codon:yes stop_codon:yes gene_type:complete